MERRKSKYLNRRADNHATIQNLRKTLREYLTCGGTKQSFARRMNMSLSLLNQYLTGLYIPTKRTIEKWATFLGLTYDELTTADFDYIPYPFEEMFKPRVQSHHLTKREVRQSYEAMIDEYETMAKEGEVEYNAKIIDLMNRYKV